MSRPRVVVIGAGMAGASAAWAFAERADVILLEAESAPGYHSTGRSAATWTETYGSSTARALTRASGAFLRDPPAGFAAGELVRQIGVLTVARADQADALEAFMADVGAHADRLDRVDAAGAVELAPWLDRGYLAAGAYEPGALSIDVDALHQGYLRGLRARGAKLLTDCRVQTFARAGGSWRLETSAGPVEGEIVVNAAGAWADEIARLAGLRPVGLVPKRRTAVLVEPPESEDPSGWPMVDDVGGEFYAKPEAGWLLVSPQDETPVAPQDAQPEEWDVAVAVDRFEQASGRPVRRVGRRWAGLRTFAPDRAPVIGPDPVAPTFGWLAGQGGFGIMTAPAAAAAIVGLMLDGALPAELKVAADALSPARFRKG